MLLAIFTFISQFDVFSHAAYHDRAQYTYGYGTRSTSAHQVISVTEAKKVAFEAIKNHLEAVLHLAHLSEQQKIALTSFSYNVGENAFLHSALHYFVQKGEFCAARQEFAKWIYQSHRKLAGLVKRRQAERALFSTGLKC